MIKNSALSMLLLGALVGVAPAGCGRTKNHGQEDTGTVTFMLSATGASGKTYRLRSATFSVTGPETKSIASPTDPADPLAQITAPLLPGTYQITLTDGWKMWRVPSTGAPVEVQASLISPKMVAFSIASSQDTKLTFQFDVEGEPLLPGTVTIGIGVTEVDGAIDGPPDAGTTPDVSTTPDVGTTAVCGNGAVETGEQCDSSAAFANHTCDQTNCQSIAVVCGNHLVQPGEQCDDGPTGSATCTVTCTTVVATSTCLQCETAGSNDASGGNPPTCKGTKLTVQSTVVGCAALSAANKTMCTALLNCLQTHPNCSITPANPVVNDDPTGCFCGALSAASCSGTPSANIAGQCAAAYFAVYGGVSDTNRDSILGDFFNRTLPVGMANNLYACDVDNHCQSQCP